jgi:hypothetical protein
MGTGVTDDALKTCLSVLPCSRISVFQFFQFLATIM